MTKPHPTRREAYAWWESLGLASACDIALKHGDGRDDLLTFVRRWWRSLPDERADEIRRKENRG